MISLSFKIFSERPEVLLVSTKYQAASELRYLWFRPAWSFLCFAASVFRIGARIFLVFRCGRGASVREVPWSFREAREPRRGSCTSSAAARARVSLAASCLKSRNSELQRKEFSTEFMKHSRNNVCGSWHAHASGCTRVRWETFPLPLVQGAFSRNVKCSGKHQSEPSRKFWNPSYDPKKPACIPSTSSTTKACRPVRQNRF